METLPGQLRNLLPSHPPLVGVRSAAQDDVLVELGRFVGNSGRLEIWRPSGGFRTLGTSNEQNASPLDTLDAVAACEGSGLFVFIDFDPHLKTPAVLERISTLREGLKEQHKTLLFLSSTMVVPPALELDIIQLVDPELTTPRATLTDSFDPTQRMEQSERWPRGWYFVEFGESIARGEVRPIRLFGRNWALFRTRSGKVGLLDPVCVHLGSDLARAGKVCGERLQCSFHAWEFETDGRCTHAPRVSPIPKAARQNALTVIERLGNIWVWYGEGQAEPFLDVDTLETAQYQNFRGEIHSAETDCRSAMEHGSDNYHFTHNHYIRVRHDWTLLADEGIRYAFRIKMLPEDEAHPLFKWVRGLGRMEYAGPCTSLYRVLDNEDAVESPQSVLVLAVTPVDASHTLLSWRVLARKPSTNPLFALPSRAVTELVYRYFRLNVFLDLHVLQTMHRVDRPLWVAADGESVRAYRNFYARNLIETPLAFRGKSREYAGILPERPHYSFLA